MDDTENMSSFRKATTSCHSIKEVQLLVIISQTYISNHM